MNRRPFYAANARQLLETRQRGLLPAGPVVVSLTGGNLSHVASTTLFVRDDMPMERLDWRMLVNLEVWLLAGAQAQLSQVLQVCAAIARTRPKRLVLRFEDGSDMHDVEVGDGHHHPAVLDLPAVHTFKWTPINLTGSRTGAKLRAALSSVHAPLTVL